MQNLIDLFSQALRLKGFSEEELDIIGNALAAVEDAGGNETLLSDEDKDFIRKAKIAINNRNKNATTRQKKPEIPSGSKGPNIENILNTYSIVGLSQALMVSVGRMSMDEVHPQSRARVKELLNNYDENTIGEALKQKHDQTTSARSDILDKVKNHGSISMIKQQMPKLNSLNTEVKNLLVTLFKSAQSKKDEIELKLINLPFRFFDPTYKKRVYRIYQQYSDLIREKLFDLVSIAINQQGQNLQNYRVKAEEFTNELNEFINQASNDLDIMANSNHPVSDEFIKSAYDFVVNGQREGEPVEENGEPLSVDSFREKIKSTLSNAFRSR